MPTQNAAAVQLLNTFTIDVPPDQCFPVLLDLPLVGGCVPGAHVGPRDADGSHPVALTIRIGPMKLEYVGRVTIGDQDDRAHTAALQVKMKTSSGGERAQARTALRVDGTAQGSVVEMKTEVALHGRAASFGQAFLSEIARRLLDSALACVEARIRAAVDASGGALTGADEA